MAVQEINRHPIYVNFRGNIGGFVVFFWGGGRREKKELCRAKNPSYGNYKTWIMEFFAFVWVHIILWILKSTHWVLWLLQLPEILLHVLLRYLCSLITIIIIVSNENYLCCQAVFPDNGRDLTAKLGCQNFLTVHLISNESITYTKLVNIKLCSSSNFLKIIYGSFISW